MIQTDIELQTINNLNNTISQHLEIKGLFFPNRMWLAPMASMGDEVFRRLCMEFGAGALVTEMVSVKGLIMGNEKTFQMIKRGDERVPIGVQLFGGEPDDFKVAGRIVIEQGWKWIDVNAGCPVKKVIKQGAGADLLRDLDRLKAILMGLRELFDGLLSVKIRAGWSDKDDHEGLIRQVGRIVDEVGVDMVTLHARTRQQGYSGKANWRWIRVLRESTSAIVVGNGDVMDMEDAHKMMVQTGCDAVMVGRGALGAPWIFSKKRPLPEDVERTILQHVNGMILKIGDETRAISAFRSHLIKYVKRLGGGARLRMLASKVQNREDVICVIGELTKLAKK